MPTSAADAITALAEHYLPAPPGLATVGPSIVTLVSIQFDYTDDLPAAVRKWEQLGFVRVGASSEASPADRVDRSGFPLEAAGFGASLVVSVAAPAPAQAVYLAPASQQAREAGRAVRGVGSTIFELREPPPAASSHLGPETHEAARILLDDTQDLQATAVQWESAGFSRLGSSDAVIKNNQMGFSDILAYTAYGVGATLVAFQITPAKLRRIRRLDDGRIDMDAVHADPPSQLSPGGSSVIRAVFFAPASPEARSRAEAALVSNYVPVAPGFDGSG
jgi:hypothetical protein